MKLRLWLWLLAMTVVSACSTTTDYFGDGIVEAEYFDSISAMAASADLVISGVVTDVRLADYTSPGYIEAFASAEIDIALGENYGHRSGYRQGITGSKTTVLFGLNGVSRAEEDLRSLKAALPTSTSWWFLRQIETTSGDFYILVNTVALLTASDDGSNLIAAFYPVSSEEARSGKANGDHAAFLQDAGSTRPDDVHLALVGAASGNRDAGRTVPVESRPG